MMPEEELISIVIPVYNAALYIERALKSVREQSYRNWELILIDDASRDNSVSIMKDWEKRFGKGQVRILQNEKNEGPAKTRNAGISTAKGRYLVYLDADDYWDSKKLEKQYRFMRERDCAFSFTGYEFADRQGKCKGKKVHVPEQISYEEALTNTTISTITVMLDRKKIPEELLLMPEDCQREDTATWWKILKQGYTAYGLDEALSVYCRHKGSHSANKLRAIAGTYHMYRKVEGFGLTKTWICMSVYLMGAVKRRI